MTIDQLRIDTVILDCEGCYVEFVEDNIERFKSQVKTIILENDHINNTATLVFLDKLRLARRHKYHTTYSFLAPTGAQGVAISVCLSVRHGHSFSRGR